MWLMISLVERFNNSSEKYFIWSTCLRINRSYLAVKISARIDMFLHHSVGVAKFYE